MDLDRRQSAGYEYLCHLQVCRSAAQIAGDVCVEKISMVRREESTAYSLVGKNLS